MATVPALRWRAGEVAREAVAEATRAVAGEAAGEATSEVAGELGWPWLRAANAALAIDAETIACGWDGSPADYGLLVDHLIATDELR